MMTSAQVVKTSVNVTSNSPSQDYTHLDDHNWPNYVRGSVWNNTKQSQLRILKDFSRGLKTCPGKVEHNRTNAISHLEFVDLLKNNEQWQAEAYLSKQRQVEAGWGQQG